LPHVRKADGRPREVRHRLPVSTLSAVILDAAPMARLNRHLFEFEQHRADSKPLEHSTCEGL
jgi:hypothetical protein